MVRILSAVLLSTLFSFSAQAEEPAKPILPPQADQPAVSQGAPKVALPTIETKPALPPQPTTPELAPVPEPAPPQVAAPKVIEPDPNLVIDPNLPPEKQPLTQPVISHPNMIGKGPRLKSINDVSQEQLKPQTAANAKPLEPPSFDKSLMFKSEDLQRYRIVYDSYMERLRNTAVAVPDSDQSKIGQLINKLGINEPKKDLPNAPTGIYLNSIMYRSNENAVAWINGKKFEIGTSLDGIKLLNVSATTAQIAWDTTYYNVDLSQWTQNFPQDADKTKMSPKRREINVDAKTRNVFFSLRPNQRLDTEQMAVLEGKSYSNVLTKDTLKTESNLPVANKAPAPASAPAPANIPAGKPLTEPAAIDEKTPASVPEANEKMASFKVAADRHFYIPAQLNGVIVDFKVDTGATISAISTEDASRIGIDVSSLDFKYDVKIADGSIIKAAEAIVKDFTIGEIRLQNVNLLVAQGKMAQPLLGMSFLSKLKRFTVEGETLSLFQ